MTSKERQLGCKESILQKIDQLMTDMSNRHSKVFFMRFDIRFPQGYDYPNDNELFSQFQESFIKNRKRAGYDPAYIAVRECSREKHQHYHVALMMNGHKTQNIHDHIQTAERLWEKTLNLPPKCDNTGRTTSYGLIDDCMRNRQGQPQETVSCSERMIPSMNANTISVSDVAVTSPRSTRKTPPPNISGNYFHPVFKNNHERQSS